MMYPELDRSPTWHFIEVYMEYDRQMPTIMFLVSRTNGDYEVLDTNYKVRFVDTSYEEATYWLNEDEFTRVSERITPEDTK
jgi:hypothetical protein